MRIPHGPGVRDDGGVYEGAEVSIYYDPMISKFATYGKDRAEAINRMRRALAEYEIGGIRTTLSFFREVIEDEELVAGKIDTGFISRWMERREMLEANREQADLAIIAAALASMREATVSQPADCSPPSKWAKAGRLARLGQ